ncbi:hypothetical protein [Rhizobium sp. YTU87027]|uniref:hypothetical protein n=1 Tax=Rhizobium sp. YTU87027 TaxID=3417741 RepID=UPI003D689C65
MSYSQALPVYASILVTGIVAPIFALSAAETAAVKSARNQSISILVAANLEQGKLTAPATSIDWWLREDIVHASHVTDSTKRVFNPNWLNDYQLRGSH